MTTKLGTDHCPTCGKVCSAATSINPSAVPTPGDLSVCLYCGALLKFADDMALKELTAQELFECSMQDAEAARQLLMARESVRRYWMEQN